ncbi:hypothetical protein [Dickeya sp. NCPPB 3274]|uniref:hypothetical protein n=1 Tax=Dickeya sp. NCPPB 3274 TaxID=568766 RepID=UPI0005B3EEF9|nr:hypothetical protein [Dickeya sp. NCPPB 3274]
MKNKNSKSNNNRWVLFMMIFGPPAIYAFYGVIEYYTSKVSEKGQYEATLSWDICINSYAYNYDKDGILRPVEIFHEDKLNDVDGYKHPVRTEAAHCDIR